MKPIPEWATDPRKIETPLPLGPQGNRPQAISLAIRSVMAEIARFIGGSPVDGEFLVYDASTGKYSTAAITPASIGAQATSEKNQAGGYVGIDASGNISITGTGTATAWIETSDRRIKSNIDPINGALDRLHRIGGYTFDKKGEDRRMAGVIAQEVAAVFPEAVTEDDLLAVSPSAILGLVIEAIKELSMERKA